MRAGAAKGREDTLGDPHSAEILGARLAADKDQLDFGVLFVQRLGVGSVETDLAGGRAWTGGDALRQQLALRLGCFFSLGIEDRLQELIEVVGGNSPLLERFLLGD